MVQWYIINRKSLEKKVQFIESFEELWDWTEVEQHYAFGLYTRHLLNISLRGVGGDFPDKDTNSFTFFCPPLSYSTLCLRHSKIYKITRCALCYKQIGCSTTHSYSIASYSKQSSEIRNSCIPLCFLEYFYHWRYVVKKVWY